MDGFQGTFSSLYGGSEMAGSGMSGSGMSPMDGSEMTMMNHSENVCSAGNGVDSDNTIVSSKSSGKCMHAHCMPPKSKIDREWTENAR
jgi:hypothetical protein